MRGTVRILILKFNQDVIYHVSGIQHPEDNGLTASETKYLEKVDWLWQQLSPSQKSKIVYSVSHGTLRQGSGKHCFIAVAISIKIKTPVNNYLLDKLMQLVSSVFYDGPSYDFLLDTKISPDDKKKLDDIYYARIGNREHRYQRATELVRAYVTRRLITVK